MILEFYNKINYEWADPRTNNFLLISSPFKLLALIGIYLWFCLKAGPHFMKNRKPFQLRKTLIVYNLFQIFISFYFFIKGAEVWIYDYDLRCAPVDYSVSPRNEYLVGISHLYLFAKLSELLDTVFFTLRKKYSQVTALHLYHHTTMVVIAWIGIKYFAGGHSILMPTINSFVHIVMYTYYLLACLGPKYQKYLTWKKQITQLQLVQFVIIIIHNMQAFFRTCDYPKWILFFGSCEAILFIYLFSKFYIKAYHNANKSKSKRDTNEELNNKSVCEKKIN